MNEPPPESLTTIRQPPSSTEAEQAVIGAILTDASLVHLVNLPVEAFYRREHRVLWEAISGMKKRGEPIDALTLSEVLASSQKLYESGGLEYIAMLATSSSVANTGRYAAIVQERAQERRMIAIGHGIADAGYNPDGLSVNERVANAIQQLTSIEIAEDDEAISMAESLKEAVGGIEKRFERNTAGQHMHGTPTGYRDIDDRLMGMKDGDMILLAGRPSMGKTAWALNIAENCALAGELALIFSLEMTREQLMQRMIASVGRIPLDIIRRGNLAHEHWDKVNQATAKLQNADLWIDDRPIMTSEQMMSRARRIAARRRRKPGLIVIDYLQLLRDKGDGEARISGISRNIKLMARELNCPVIALSQLNRSLESRADKRPIMSDLRESGALEQDADLIAMIYRDKYYNPNQNEDVAEVIWRKFRNGTIGTDRLVSRLDMSRFEDMVRGTNYSPKAQQPRMQGFD